MNKKLSGMDKEIYGIMRSYYMKRHTVISVRSIAREVGLYSSSSVQYHIEKLKDLGYLNENREPVEF